MVPAVSVKAVESRIRGTSQSSPSAVETGRVHRSMERVRNSAAKRWGFIETSSFHKESPLQQMGEFLLFALMASRSREVRAAVGSALSNSASDTASNSW